MAIAMSGTTSGQQLIAPGAKVEKISGGHRFVEGPVWFGDASVTGGGYLLFSDIPASTIHRWDAGAGTSVFRTPSGQSNGNSTDRQGRLITAEHQTRRVTRTETDGTLTVLAERFEGKRLNSPNDLVTHSGGAIYFTDPPYGVKPADRELDHCSVYRLSADGTLTRLTSELDHPNGLCFSPDEKRLYVADSGKPKAVRVFDVTGEGLLVNGRVFAGGDQPLPGSPDGIRCDEHGNLWVTCGDGVRVYSPDGLLLHTVALPEAPANCTFGGPDRKTLFMTARTSVYRITTLVAGASPGGAR